MDLNEIYSTFSKKRENLIDRKKLEESGENIYSIINILAQRASQISAYFKEELHEKLSDFSAAKEDLEENNQDEERAEIVNFFEKLPKPTTIAIEEFLEGKLTYRKSDQ